MYDLTNTEDELNRQQQQDVQIVDNNYAFRPTSINFLGEGAFGYVYKGYNLKDPDQHVAIKSIASNQFKRQELQLLCKVQSEHLVKFLLICSKDDITYIVMELCDGDLAGYLAEWSKLDVANVLTLADNLARGYKVLQMHKIVHRDIKPQNILIKYDRNDRAYRRKRIMKAKLSDFGTSHLVTDEHDQICNVAGTLFYMAPEVGANLVATNAYDHSADMWSIGCVLFEAITGSTPFDERSLCRLFLQVACKSYRDDVASHLTALQAAAASNGSKNAVSQFDYVADRLLRVDPRQRMSPQQLVEQAADDLARTAVKANVRHRFSAVYGRQQNDDEHVDGHSKSCTNFNSTTNWAAAVDRRPDSGVRRRQKARALSECRNNSRFEAMLA